MKNRLDESSLFFGMKSQRTPLFPGIIKEVHLKCVGDSDTFLCPAIILELIRRLFLAPENVRGGF